MNEYAIEFRGLTKRFGAVIAVDDLTFTAAPGKVTGFLGPNGAGKSTALKSLVGLVRPTAGLTTIGGTAYASLPQPAATVGIHLAPSFHPDRKAIDHLKAYAPVVGVTDGRCGEVLEQVGLAEASGRRVGGFSLGMKQRLGLATALLGSPQVLVLDESANGLDPAGVRWLRDLLHDFARSGGTVLLSSHMLSEVQQTVDDVVIIANGRLKHASSLAELTALATPGVSLTSPDAEALRAFVENRFAGRGTVTSTHTAHIGGESAAAVGAAAFAEGLELHELVPTGETLESIFLRLTSEEAK